MIMKSFAIAVIAMNPQPQVLPPLTHHEVVVLNGVNWRIRVLEKKLVIDRVSVRGTKLNEYVIGGKTITADKRFWESSDAERRRLLVNSRIQIEKGALLFDGSRIDCGGREILRLMGDAISLGDGVAVGVELKSEKNGYPGFIHLLYFDPASKKASFHEVVGNMSSLDFIFFMN